MFVHGPVKGSSSGSENEEEEEEEDVAGDLLQVKIKLIICPNYVFK